MSIVKFPQRMRTNKKEYCVAVSISVPLKELIRVQDLMLKNNLKRSDVYIQILRLGIDKFEENMRIDLLQKIEKERKIDRYQLIKFETTADQRKKIDNEIKKAKKRLKKTDAFIEKEIINEK